MDRAANLDSYINEHRDTPFEWGKHDCLTFIAGAIEAQTGHRPFQWVPDYATALQARAFADVDVMEQLDAIMTRTKCNPATRGAIVARKNGINPVLGYSLGVATGRFVAFVGPYGLEFDKQREEDAAWVV